MIRSLNHPSSRTVAALAAGFVLWVASAQGLLAAGPRDQAELLLPPILAILAASIAAFFHVDPRRWPIEGVGIAAVVGTLGVGWGVGVILSSLFVRWCVAGPRDWTTRWPFEVLAVLLASGVALSLEAPYAAVAFVAVWLAVRRTAPGPGLAIFSVGLVGLGLTLTLGSAGVLALALPTGLILAIAREEALAAREHRQTLEALGLMLQRAHPYTHAHIERVARIAERTARMLGLSPRRAALVHRAARLHDVGKIAIDEAVLDKPGRLTPEEYAHVKLHAPFGAAILEEVAELRSIAGWIRCHHERPDGNGYPRGLKGDEIPLEARIIAAADAFDAMTGGFHEGEKRPYREPISPQEALAELDRCSGSQFDPRVVAAFRKAVAMEAPR